MPLRRALWIIACILFAVAAFLHYSPKLGRHTPTLVNLGLALFTLGWLVHGAIHTDD